MAHTHTPPSQHRHTPSHIVYPSHTPVSSSPSSSFSSSLRYLNANPGSFRGTDSVHVLSYALIMLQTNLHNPNVKRRDRMSITQFVKSLRGVDDGHDIAETSLKAFYKRIKRDKFELEPASSDGRTRHFSYPTLSGPCAKINKKQQWQRRQGVVSDGHLFFFHSPNDAIPNSAILLEGTGGTLYVMIPNSCHPCAQTIYSVIIYECHLPRRVLENTSLIRLSSLHPRTNTYVYSHQ